MDTCLIAYSRPDGFGSFVNGCPSSGACEVECLKKEQLGVAFERGMWLEGVNEHMFEKDPILDLNVDSVHQECEIPLITNMKRREVIEVKTMLMQDGGCQPPISIPSALKLVSAMKGGREKEGHPSKLTMNVKWAPDVYDPPITLMSHTVKNYHHQQQRRKPKKKDRNKHTNKHKGKSSRGAFAG